MHKKEAIVKLTEKVMQDNPGFTKEQILATVVIRIEHTVEKKRTATEYFLNYMLGATNQGCWDIDISTALNKIKSLSNNNDGIVITVVKVDHVAKQDTPIAWYSMYKKHGDHPVYVTYLWDKTTGGFEFFSAAAGSKQFVKKFTVKVHSLQREIERIVQGTEQKSV